MRFNKANRVRLAAVGVACLAMVLFAGTYANAERVSDIRNTKHNLSVSSGGNVKATAEDQVCAFCHTPHHAETLPKAPLWNRKASGATYTPYTSSSINANDIAATPGGSSKLCLSCHDGTIAVGSVNVLEGAINVSIDMQGTGAGGVMPVGAGLNTGFTRRLGFDLTNDHPISFTYDSALASADGELRDPAVEAHIGNPQVGADPIVPLQDGQIQCTSCHEPHIRDTDPSKVIKFLRLNRFQELPPVGGAFSEANDIICLACHDKLGQAWSGSAHASPVVADETYTAAAAAQREFPSTIRVWQAACLNCHDTHTVQGSRRLLREGTDSVSTPKSGGNSAIEETCYQCHSSDGGVLTGQGGGSFPVPDIKTDFTFSSIHMPIESGDQPAGGEVHDVVNADLVEPATLVNNSNRHVECTDCHNPHRVMRNRLFNANGATTAGTHAHGSGHNNIASGVLRGSWGVEPLYGSTAFNPANLPTFSLKSGDGGSGAATSANSGYVTREYQICLRCHSSYAYGSNPPDLGNSGGNTAYGTNGVTEYTDQAMEFQAPSTHRGDSTASNSGADAAFATNNHRSWHPVIGSTGRSSSYRNSWLSPWNASGDIGNQTMYCSDCHGSDTASGTVVPTGGEDGSPWGPHGSANNFLLKGTWTGNSESTSICFKCHDSGDYNNAGADTVASGFFNSDRDNLHAYHRNKVGPLRCTWCHVAVPHGWKNKTFLVNLNDVGPEVGLPSGTQVRNDTTAPYTNGPYYLNAILKVRVFSPSGNWNAGNCGSVGAPGNGENGRDWMRDGSENCENPP